MARAEWLLAFILILSMIVLLPSMILATRVKQDSSEAETRRGGHCLEAGKKCEEPEACCTSNCRAVKNRKNKACCVPEGSLCNPGNPARAVCCGAASCSQLEHGRDKNRVQDRKIFMCQVIVQPIKYDMRIPYKKKV